MRFAELALISLPVLLAAAWLMGLRHASFRVFMLMAVVLAGIGTTLVIFGEQRGFTGTYTPAKLQNGQVVPEHGE